MARSVKKLASQPRVFKVKDPPINFVLRQDKFAELLSTVLDGRRKEPVTITTALLGAGGYGKTTLAQALCYNERVQKTFHDGILWVTLGKEPGKLIEVLENLIYFLSDEHSDVTGIEAVTQCFADLLDDQDILLVIDDVWNEADLEPFLQRGKHCTRLITTRDERVLPRGTHVIQVAAMNEHEATYLLSLGLDESVRFTGDIQVLERLATTKLGQWPILLNLVNRALLERIDHDQSLLFALEAINRTLDEKGLTGFDRKDAKDPAKRERAVTKTLEMSFDSLEREEYWRYRELAVFPENTDIPLTTVQRLWGTTGQLNHHATESLCLHLSQLSLLLQCDLKTSTIRLHDVFRTHLQREVGAAGLEVLHQQLLSTYRCPHWVELPDDEPYLWEHLAEHLIGAGRREELIATVKDGGYLAKKTHVCSVYAVETDLDMAVKQTPTATSLRLLKSGVARMSHLLNQCETLQEVAAVLHSRFWHLPELSSICITLEQNLPRPFLTSWYAFKDLSHVALIRTLQGHRDWVRGCAISLDGNWIISASSDKTLKVWDAHTGAPHLTLTGHTDGVNGCAVSLDGNWIVSASSDETLKVWNAHTGDVQFTLTGHTNGVNGCAVSPDGNWIVSASSDKTLKVWDAHTGDIQFTLTGHTNGVNGCAVSPDGNWIVSASSDKTLKVWDAHTGAPHLTLTGHTDGVNGCAVSPDGNRVVSASSDESLKVWNAHTGDVQFTLTSHTNGVNGCAVSSAGDYIVSTSSDQTLKMWDAQTEAESLILVDYKDVVNSCAVSPDGNRIVSASYDKTLKAWDAHTGDVQFTLMGHTDVVNGCAFSPNGNWIVSASSDKTLKVWDAHTGDVQFTLTGHTDVVNGCAFSPDGNWIVSASYDKTLNVWDAHTGDVQFTLTGHTDVVNGCAFGPDGNWIVSASYDKTFKAWDAHTGDIQFTLMGHTDVVNGCAFSPDGNWIVSASYDKTLKVWDAHTGDVRFTLTGHIGGVYGCAFSPDGNWIVSASSDKTLKVWDAHTGACLMTLLVDGKLRTCAFCPDGTHLIAGGEGGIYFLQLVQ